MTLKEHPAKALSLLPTIWRVAFSPDGKRILAVGNFTIVAVWDAATGQTLPALEGHRSWINALAFSPDGKLLATGSGDRTIRAMGCRHMEHHEDAYRTRQSGR